MTRSPKASKPPKRIQLLRRDLPPLKLHEWNTVPSQIAGYLGRLIEKHAGSGAQLELPSLAVLAEFFQCCEMDILGALNELRQQSFTYDVHGLDTPLSLSNPLNRKYIGLKPKPNATSRMYLDPLSFRRLDVLPPLLPLSAGGFQDNQSRLNPPMPAPTGII